MRSFLAPFRSSRFLTRSLATTVEAPTTSQLLGDSNPVASTSTAVTPDDIDSVPPGQWTPFTQRTGVIARKRGMTALWDQRGRRWPVTVLQVDQCQVVRVQPPPANTPLNATPLHSLQLGASNRPIKTTQGSLRGHFRAAGVPPKYKLQEFRVTADAVLPVGTELSAGHYVPGQFVDVTATSIGKGFQGVMKRHGFRGLKATHGVSLTHRSGGSTGQHQDPGRVLPGKKMAGHMGNVKRTTQNLLVHRVDLDLNCIFVRGAVPGVDDAFVSVRDAKKKVGYKAQAAFRSGKEKDQWLGEGITTLPVPAGTVTRAAKEAWPAVAEWQGKALKGQQ